jgi:hypothetical protein
MTRGERIVLLFLLIALIFVCGTDFLVDAVRTRHGDAASFVHVRKYNAVSDGDGHYHFAYFGDMDEPCDRALLPHRGLWPCWWVRFNKNDWDR